MNVKERIGVVGLGVMGSAMSGHLLAAGYQVHGFDVLAEKVDAFAREGGVPETSGAAVAASSDVLLLSLPSVDALEAAIAEIVRGAHSGLTAVEMGTLPLEAKEKARDTLEAAGVELMS